MFVLCTFTFTNAQQWCGRTNPEFCPGNYFNNGNFEALTGNPSSSVDEDINLSTGWYKLWSGGGGTADLACGGTVHSGAMTAPNPNTGVYSGMWIINSTNRTSESSTYREGMYNKLQTPVPSNTGNYSFNFDIANAMLPGTNPSTPVLIDVYGVYNPAELLGASPITCYNPSNYNLWAFNPSVEVVLLGTITTPAGFNNNWSSQSITFNSAIISSPNITHIMITRSEQAVTFWNKLYINFDNFCMQKLATNEGAYCCKGDNLVQNGNFENGNTGFTSAYTYQSTVSPNSVLSGQHSIVNSSEAATISPQWQVQDHTFCVNGSNSDFMVVNGRTQQAPGTTSVIYENTVTLDPEKEHKLCLNLKNLPQCTFDIIPRVRIEITNATFTDGYNGNWFPVNTTADLCDWLNINACFRLNGDTQTATIRIYLAEDGIGDGNDLALDDISIQEKLEQDSYITVEHVGASNQITASINDLTNADDVLLTTGDCELQENYYWFVYEVSSYPLTGPLANITTGTFAWSSNVGGWNDQTASAVSPAWGLTTLFPGYTFDNNKLYAIGLYIPSCCNSCYDEKWTYQLTFNFRGGEGFILTHDMKEEIKALFKMGEGMTPNNGVLESTSNLKIHPNPSSSIFNLDFKEPTSGEINVIDINGRTLFSQDILEQNSFELNLENQSSGMYFVKIKSVSGEYSEKIIKK